MDLNVLTLRHPVTLGRLAWKKLLRVVRRQSVETDGERSARSDEPLIDVRSLLQERSLEDLNRTAEHYFASLSTWDYHLAKPFSTPEDAPGLLINFATMLQGLALFRGARVLDFGAGSGWTSRYLTQLGCEVVVLDVSGTALQIAQRLYERQPVIGDQPQPRFLRYDGRKIDLPDASVDRILCFDAFHHSPNPEEVLGEFARVLVPGGIAAFAEPGPQHSRTPQSQFEMRTYGVLENDIDLHSLWKAAQHAGFAAAEVAAYNVPRFTVPLEKYDDLLAGGEAYLRWAESTRGFLADVSNFFLRRAGEEVLDSRRPQHLAAAIAVDAPARVDAGQPIRARATVSNRGRAVWLRSDARPGGVSLGCHLYARSGQLAMFDYHWRALTDPPRSIRPGEEVHVELDLPPLAAGEYTLEFDCVSSDVAWFAQSGSPVVRVSIEVV